MSYPQITGVQCKEFITEFAQGRVGMQWDPAGDPEGPNGDGTGLPDTRPPNTTTPIEWDELGEPVSYGSSNQANFDSMIRRTADYMIAEDAAYQEKLAAYGTLVTTMQLLVEMPLPAIDADMIVYVTQFATVP